MVGIIRSLMLCLMSPTSIMHYSVMMNNRIMLIKTVSHGIRFKVITLTRSILVSVIIYLLFLLAVLIYKILPLIWVNYIRVSNRIHKLLWINGLSDFMVNKYINAQYQEIYDIATTPNKVTIIGIRTPSGSVPSKMLAGLWTQFKSVKYNGADFVMRATARQPLDPLQVGNTAGSQMDMRDVQNPILFRGCHGESLGAILNDLMSLPSSGHGFVGDSLDIDSTDLSDAVENFYYQCLTDMSWKKSMPENGFAFNGLRPLVYGMATNFQLQNVPTGDDSETYVNDPGWLRQVDDVTTKDIMSPDFAILRKSNGSVSNTGGRQVFTNDLQPLGWMDTENRVGGTSTDPFPVAYIPRAYMAMLLLPPSYTDGVQQYFRMVITHYFTFKDFRSISLDSDYSSTPGYYDTINVSDGSKAVLTSARVH